MFGIEILVFDYSDNIVHWNEHEKLLIKDIKFFKDWNLKPIPGAYLNIEAISLPGFDFKATWLLN